MKISHRNLIWVIAPIALSAGVLWLSAQDKVSNEGVVMGDLAEKLQAREKAASQKETSLSRLQQRLNTLQTTLAREQERVMEREKALEAEKAKFEAEKKIERERLKELEKTFETERLKALDRIREEQTRELEKIRAERDRLRTAITVDDQLIRTYEAMEPVAASRALQELAKTNFDIAVGLMASMNPKKAARVMDQLVPLDTKLSGDLSERIGLIKKEEKK